MKRILFLTACVVSATLAAVDFDLIPVKSWLKTAPDACTINYDGSKSWPSIKIVPKTTKPNALYRLSLHAESTEPANWQTCTQIMKNGEPAKTYNTLLGNKKRSDVTRYIRTTESPELNLTISLNPGVKTTVNVTNIKLDEITTLPENLLRFGNFEEGCDLGAFNKTSLTHFHIVPSPSFFCGEKSLKLTSHPTIEIAVSSDDLPAIPGKTIDVKFFARSNGLTAGMNVYCDFFRNKHNRHLYKMFRLKIGPEWQEYTCSYTIPTDKVKYNALEDGLFRLKLSLPTSQSTYSAYIDEVQVSIR